MPIRVLLAVTAVLLSAASPSARAQQASRDAERFRAEVLPILERRCFECHGPDADDADGGLRMTGRDALLRGGESGPAVVSGRPDESLLVEAVRWSDPWLEMPPDGRLPPAEVAVLELWVEAGAPWPDDDVRGEDDAVSGLTARDLERARDFEQDVRPILAAHCFECHGPDVDEPQGGLRMTGASSLRRGGARGAALVPGDPEASLLVRAVRYASADLRMPPSGPIPREDVARLERWIADGAVWPDAEDLPPPHEEPGIDVEAGRSWWAFRPVERPEPPRVADPALVRNAVDAFVVARLEERGLRPNPPADDATLVRRAYHDLVGLPPTYAEVEAFVADRAPDKWKRLVDELLARPEYGERWGRHWLDVVRFAQTNGYEKDEEKPGIWRYRDWVVDAFARDMPWDNFLAAQLAGDELPGAGEGALVATGFYHLGTWDSEPDDREQADFDAYDDVLRAVGEGMMGVTLGCARCHDHKFDPIRQSDYYEMLAFVRNVRPYAQPKFSIDSPTLAPLAFTPEARRQWNVDRAAAVRAVHEELDGMLADRRSELFEERLSEAPPEVREAFAAPRHERTPEQEAIVAEQGPRLMPTMQEAREALTDHERGVRFARRLDVDRLRASFPGDLEWALVAREYGGAPRETFLHVRGRAGSPGPSVEPRFLAVLVEDDAARVPEVESRRGPTGSSGRRRALAEWITDPAHPTTARVAVNRIWQGHFGRGIVPTPNDFGATGLPPTHPELLDWLAAEFVARGWSVKAMHRLLMGSATYRMSSSVADNPRAARADEPNDLFWRQAMRRREAEAVRDAVLLASGCLSDARGGRGFFPELSREALAGGSRPGQGWDVSPQEERDRRAVYAYVKRGLPVPFLDVLDMANPTMPVGRRHVTTIASQAFTLLNSDFMNREARHLAERVAAAAGDGLREQVEAAFRFALARAPDDAERALCEEHVRAQEAGSAARPEALVFRNRIPERLDLAYLEQLEGRDMFDGPDDGWRWTRGVWGTPYNGTYGVEPDRGPAALWEGASFRDGALEGVLVLHDGCVSGSLLARGDVVGGELVALEVLLDPVAGEVRVVRHAAGAARVLGRAPADILREHPHALSVTLAGTDVEVRLDGDVVLRAEDPDAGPPGALGVRAWGDALSVSGLAAHVRDAGGSTSTHAPPAADPVPPRLRALESLALVLLNTNEFVTVD